MTLAHPFVRSPFGLRTSGQFDFEPPEHMRYWEPWPRRMRAVLVGETVLDSQRGIMVWETGEFPTHYYPLDDIRADLIEEASCTHPQDGRRQWSVRVGERFVENCLTASPAGRDGEELLKGYVTFHQSRGAQGESDPHAMDEWFEEDDLIYREPRDPYHRVDVRSSSRQVVVRHFGQIIARSARPKLLFETGQPIRYYLPQVDARLELLDKSGFISVCPFKGEGQHWHLAQDGEVVQDAAWSLPHPLPAGVAAAGHVCFYPEKVEVEVDGKRILE